MLIGTSSKLQKRQCCPRRNLPKLSLPRIFRFMAPLGFGDLILGGRDGSYHSTFKLPYLSAHRIEENIQIPSGIADHGNSIRNRDLGSTLHMKISPEVLGHTVSP